MASETHSFYLVAGVPVGAAREFVGSVDGHLPAPVRERLALLVSELIANARMHGEPPVKLEVTWLVGTARVVVSSGGGPFKWRGRETKAGHAGGWGLVLVDAMADRWGVHHSPGLNEVWFEVDH